MSKTVQNASSSRRCEYGAGNVQIVRDQTARNNNNEMRRIFSVLRYEVEFHFPYRHRIPLLTAHLYKFFDDAAKTQYFLEI